MLLITLVTLVFLIVRWLYLERKLRRLESVSEEHERRIAQLTGRVWSLEGGTALERPVEPAVAPVEVGAGEAPAPVAASPVAPPPLPARGEDWETRLGANWLNRAGALILVVGIALFLGYSLTQLGPAGKVAIGFATGFSLLVAGTVLEGHAAYRSFSFSLVGAGWAVVYFTSYAMHALPAARLIENPAAATALLIAVSAGMILHALRYRSETATALAYLFGFVSLNVSPLTDFSVIASLLLALSLVGLAYGLRWTRLPLAGVVFTYLTFMLRHDPTIWGQAGLLNGQATLWVYWVAFEAFDLGDLHRRGGERGIERSLFLLNACGFIGASVLHEWQMNTHQWANFFLLAAAAYLGSAILRAKWYQAEAGAAERLLAGGYEAAATAASGLMAASLVARFSGIGITMALLVEGEMVFLAGLALNNTYIRGLGSVMLLAPFFRLMAVDAPGSGKTTIAGLELARWTPLAAVMAVVAVVNRRLTRGSWYFSATSGVLVFAILLTELPSAWVAPSWAAIALALFVLPSRFGFQEGRWMSLPAAVFAALVALALNVLEGNVVTCLLAAAAIYGLQLLWRRENAPAGAVLSILATALVTSLLFHEVQGRLLTVACGMEGAALLVAGFGFNERSYRLSGLALFFFCIAKLFAYDLRELDTGSRILSFIVLGLMLIAASWVYARFREKIRRLL